MRKIRVHLEEKRIITLQAPTKTLYVGSSEPLFSGSVNHKHAIGIVAKPVRKVTGAVGGIIVHHEHVEAWVLFEDVRNDAG